MVHALQEIHRVLDTDGILIDLRPLHEEVLLDIVVDDYCKPFSQFTSTQHIHKDHETAYGLERVLDAGWYVAKAQSPFDFERYWDTIAELREYIENRNPPYLLPEATIAALAHALENEPPHAQIRVTWHMNLVRYQRR